MSDSDDFFGDDSDFDESDEFSSEDAAKEGFIPTKSKNQEEDAADSQRKAEAIAKEEAGKTLPQYVYMFVGLLSLRIIRRFPKILSFPIDLIRENALCMPFCHTN